MFLSQFLALVQLLILVAMVPIVLGAQRTSRRRRSRQKTYFAMAVLLTSLSLLCVLWMTLTTSSAISGEHLSYWIALLIPGAVIPLCLWTIWRAMDKRSSKPRELPARDEGTDRP